MLAVTKLNTEIDSLPPTRYLIVERRPTMHYQEPRLRLETKVWSYRSVEPNFIAGYIKHAPVDRCL